jgi:hypothetical protein
MAGETPTENNTTVDGNNTTVDSDNATANSSFGQQVSSFMQASAADVNTSVESGMWQASVNRTLDEQGDAAPKIASRTARLQRQLQQLQERNDRLQAKRDQLPDVAYTARATALRAQLANLKKAINATSETASRVGVNTSDLDQLQSAADNVTGPDVDASARNITDVPGLGPPIDVGAGNAGPPADAKPNLTNPASNSTEANPGNGQRPTVETPADVSSVVGNETPATVGPPSNASGNGAGPANKSFGEGHQGNISMPGGTQTDPANVSQSSPASQAGAVNATTASASAASQTQSTGTSAATAVGTNVSTVGVNDTADLSSPNQSSADTDASDI